MVEQRGTSKCQLVAFMAFLVISVAFLVGMLTQVTSDSPEDGREEATTTATVFTGFATTVSTSEDNFPPQDMILENTTTEVAVTGTLVEAHATTMAVVMPAESTMSTTRSLQVVSSHWADVQFFIQGDIDVSFPDLSFAVSFLSRFNARQDLENALASIVGQSSDVQVAMSLAASRRLAPMLRGFDGLEPTRRLERLGSAAIAVSYSVRLAADGLSRHEASAALQRVRYAVRHQWSGVFESGEGVITRFVEPDLIEVCVSGACAERAGEHHSLIVGGPAASVVISILCGTIVTVAAYFMLAGYSKDLHVVSEFASFKLEALGMSTGIVAFVLAVRGGDLQFENDPSQAIFWCLLLLMLLSSAVFFVEAAMLFFCGTNPFRWFVDETTGRKLMLVHFLFKDGAQTFLYAAAATGRAESLVKSPALAVALTHSVMLLLYKVLDLMGTTPSFEPSCTCPSLRTVAAIQQEPSGDDFSPDVCAAPRDARKSDQTEWK